MARRDETCRPAVSRGTKRTAKTGGSAPAAVPLVVLGAAWGLRRFLGAWALAVALAAFLGGIGIATLLGAVNLGVAMGVGQLTFVAALVWLVLVPPWTLPLDLLDTTTAFDGRIGFAVHC